MLSGSWGPTINKKKLMVAGMEGARAAMLIVALLQMLP